MSKTRISLDIEDQWMPRLRVAAAQAGFRSVAAFLRQCVADTIGERDVEVSTQSTQNTQVEQVEQHTQTEQPVVSTKRSPMAQPKNPDLELPPNYLRKAGEVRKIPPFVGRKSGRSEDIEE